MEILKTGVENLEILAFTEADVGEECYELVYSNLAISVRIPLSESELEALREAISGAKLHGSGIVGSE